MGLRNPPGMPCVLGQILGTFGVAFDLPNLWCQGVGLGLEFPTQTKQKVAKIYNKIGGWRWQFWHFGMFFFLFRFFVLKEDMSCVNRCCLVVCSWLNCTFVWKTSGLKMTLVKVLDGLIPVSHMTLQAWCDGPVWVVGETVRHHR